MAEDEQGTPVSITNDLERRIADTFEIFDHAGNKTVDSREIGTIIRGLGCCPTEAEVQEILIAVEDHAKPETVQLATFLPYASRLITEHKYQPATPDQLLEAFHVLDPEGRGYLTKESMITFMTQDGEPFNEDELEEMLEIAIDPHTQTVPYEYYLNQLMHEPPGEEDIYRLADRIEEEKGPPPPPPKTFSETLREMQAAAD